MRVRCHISQIEAFATGAQDVRIAELTILAAALTQTGLDQTGLRVGKRGVIEHFGGQHTRAQIAEARKKSARWEVGWLDISQRVSLMCHGETPLLDTPGRA